MCCTAVDNAIKQNFRYKMKIVIDAYQAFFQAGGVQRYTRELIFAIADMITNDELILFYNRFRNQGDTWKQLKKNFRTKQVFLPRRLLQGVWDSLEWPPIEFFCGRVDIFHGLHFVLPPAKKALRVLTVHDLTYLRFPGYFADGKLNERGYKKELPHALERADAVIAVSQNTRDDLIELMGIPEEKVRVIYEGVDQHFFKLIGRPKSDAILKRYGLDPPYLIFLVGTPEPRKNLVRAVTAARQAAPELDLVLIGSEKPLRELLVGEENRNLKFLGIVPEDHLPALLSGATISLYPSLYEGFGLPVLESMASGVPVITSDRGSLPEVAGGAGILVDPENVESIAEAISGLLQDESLRNRLKVMGKARASEFTWQRTAAETLALYRELV